MDQDLKGNPVALANLSVGIRYTVQNFADVFMFVKSSTSVPDRSDKALVVKSGETCIVKRESSSENVYVWNGQRVDSGYVYYEKSA